MIMFSIICSIIQQDVCRLDGIQMQMETSSGLVQKETSRTDVCVQESSLWMERDTNSLMMVFL